MKPRLWKPMLVGLAALGTLSVVSMFSAAQQPPPPAQPQPQPPPASVLDHELLIAHALGMAIDGTSMHLMARQITTMPDREEDQGEDSLKQLRTQTRTAYEDSHKMLEDAYQALGNDPAIKPLYEAAVAYIDSLWKLAQKAAPVNENPKETKSTGNLSIEDVAAIEVINSNVRSAVNAFMIKQLTARLNPAASSTIKELDTHAGSMIKASAKTSMKFPSVPEQEAKTAKARLASLKSQEKAEPKKKAESKEAQKEQKQEKKQTKAQEKKAEKQEKKAEQAEEQEVGKNVDSPVKHLAVQGRQLIKMFEQMTGTSE